jgi:hypothetical protein
METLQEQTERALAELEEHLIQRKYLVSMYQEKLLTIKQKREDSDSEALKTIEHSLDCQPIPSSSRTPTKQTINTNHTKEPKTPTLGKNKSLKYSSFNKTSIFMMSCYFFSTK